MAVAGMFDSISIIFNPNSTGDAPKLAEQLKEDLRNSLTYSPEIRLHPTEYAGHATELARKAADSEKPLIVSVSGDGGYNEVVNGIMASGNPHAVSAVLGAGNANDHRRVTGEKPLAEAIAAGETHDIDLLHITTGSGEVENSEYAHSYIGFGLTPVVAIDLEKGGKGALTEMFTVVRTFRRFRPFEIRQNDGLKRKFDSLIFANIAEMAKYATLSEAAEQPTDGEFEVIVFPHMAKWRVLLTALRATTKGLGDQPSYSTYAFTTLKPIPYQIDGEVRSVPAHTSVRIKSIPRVLTMLG